MKQRKPAAVYHYAANELEVEANELALIAAHDGANKAGLTTACIARKQPRGSSAMTAPHVTCSSLPEVVRSLLAL